MKKLKGCIVALVTPFKDGAVDFDKLGELVDFHIKQGTDWISPCGTTGESPTLSHEEHEEVIKFVVRHTRGRVPVLAGTGSNSTSEALRLTRLADKVGADAALTSKNCVHNACRKNVEGQKSKRVMVFENHLDVIWMSFDNGQFFIH